MSPLQGYLVLPIRLLMSFTYRYRTAPFHGFISQVCYNIEALKGRQLKTKGETLRLKKYQDELSPERTTSNKNHEEYRQETHLIRHP